MGSRIPRSALGWALIPLALLLLNAASAGERKRECGGGGERPCKLWEAIPACDAGLAKGPERHCVAKLRPACGHQDLRPCQAWEAARACDEGLARDFSKDRCVAAGGSDCGRRDVRACEPWQRDQPCDPGLTLHFDEGLCKQPEDADCGGDEERPCAPLYRIPSCNPGLVEVFDEDVCVPPTCGGEWERSCQAWEVDGGGGEEPPALRSGARIRLRTTDGAYLQVVLREGRSAVEAVTGEPSAQADFSVRPAGPGSIALEASDGRLLVHVERPPMHPIEVSENAEDDDPDARFRWTVVADDRIALRASNGKYLVPVPRGSARGLEAIGDLPDSASAFFLEAL